MNKVLYFLSGAAIGGTAVFFYMKKRNEKAMENYIQQVNDSYEERYENAVESDEEAPSFQKHFSTVPKPSIDSLMANMENSEPAEHTNYNGYSKKEEKKPMPMGNPEKAKKAEKAKEERKSEKYKNFDYDEEESVYDDEEDDELDYDEEGYIDEEDEAADIAEKLDFAERINNPRTGKPIPEFEIVTDDEFAGAASSMEWDRDTVIWYSVDDVITDECDNVITDEAKEWLGPDFRDSIGIYEVGVGYVKNNRYKTIYQIYMEPCAFGVDDVNED